MQSAFSKIGEKKITDLSGRFNCNISLLYKATFTCKVKKNKAGSACKQVCWKIKALQKRGENRKKFESPRLFVIVKKMVEAKLIKTVVFQVIKSISIVEHTCACANSLL